MKTAIVHDWLEGFGGSERVLEQIIMLYPDADIFCLVDFLRPHDRGFLRGRPVYTSFLQRLPFARRQFRNFLQLMPLAIEGFDLSSYDLILSSSHSVAKGVLTGPNQVHVSYVHTPMRYAWDLQHQYVRDMRGGLRRAYARWLLHHMRLWDAQSANGVDVLIANSHAIAKRIQRVYGRQAMVIHPPVDLDAFRPARQTPPRTQYLVANRLVPYKQVHLIARAFAMMPERRLIIVGDGSERAKWQSETRNLPNIVWRGHVEKDELARLLQESRALIHAAEEDFGITLAEAQASGLPVIAYGRGGACDIVDTGAKPTGVLFLAQTPEAIVTAVERFERLTIEPQTCRDNAMRFSQERFQREYMRAVELALSGHSVEQPMLDSWREAG